MRNLIAPTRVGRVAAAVALALCVMASARAETPASEKTAESFAEMVKDLRLIPPGMHDSEVLTKVSATIDFIKQMKLPQANLAVNEALQLDPLNSHLHFLNGFVYHLQARMGDTQKGEMALEGYQQALRLDPGNWIAQEFMGMAYMDLKQFGPAKLAFSNVLLMTPDSRASIYGLMVAAYLTGDARTACAMADQFRSASPQANHGFIRSSISVYASCGNFLQAQQMREELGRLSQSRVELERVDRRLAQWKSFYLRQEQNASRQAANLQAANLQAANNPDADMLHTSLSTLPANGGPDQLAQAFTLPTPARKPPPESARPAAAPPPPPPTAAPVPAPGVPGAAAADAAADGPRMLLIDVVLLSTQELNSTSKGINLLSALKLELGSVAGNVAAFSRVITSNTTNGAPATVSTAITRAVTIPALSYSLNIANANSSVNEVLARPTLAAIEGMPSEFFSGTNLSAGVVSLSLAGGSTIVPLDKRFGIKLAVTPAFLSQGRVKLKVEAQRTALNASSDNPRVAYQIEIGEITANANVVMNLGETLVLSGLSEKTHSTIRDGVPGLQDVPGLQYVFSNKTNNDLKRSVLILITPRSPIQIAEPAADANDSMASRMKALREKFGFAHSSTPANVDAILNQLDSNEFFREFRQSDVTMEKWERMRSTGDRLREALEFLYY